MVVHKYDILKETWIYQEIQQQIVEEQRGHYLNEQQQILLEIVQVRFPDMVALTRGALAQVNDLALLRALLVKISTAQTAAQARALLAEMCGPPERA